jgi:hypothetical protein
MSEDVGRTSGSAHDDEQPEVTDAKERLFRLESSLTRDSQYNLAVNPRFGLEDRQSEGKSRIRNPFLRWLRERKGSNE